MKKKHFKFVSVVLVTALLQFSFSPFIFQVHAKIQEQLQPARGNIKKLQATGNVAIALEKTTGTKAGEILYVSRGEQLIGKVKVLKAGAGWCIAKVLSLKKGKKILAGDSVSVSKPEIVAKPVTEIQPVTIAPQETKTPVETITEKPQETETKPEEETTKETPQKKQTIDEILQELQGNKTPQETETLKEEQTVEKKKLAVMGFENLSKVADVTLQRKALDSMTEALLKTERFILVERSQIGVAMLELNLQQTEFFKPASAKKIGEFVESDLIAVGSIKSVSLLGKAQKGALVELSLRIFETETGKLLHSLSAVGESDGEGSSDYHTGQAINRASAFIVQKLPGEILGLTGGMAEVNLGAGNGIKKEQELAVYREGKEIGKIVAKTVQQRSFSGMFIASKPGNVIREGDQVFNPSIKDDTPPKKSKGGMSSTTLLLGVLALGALVGLAGGGSDGGGGTASAPIVPPGPPSE